MNHFGKHVRARVSLQNPRPARFSVVLALASTLPVALIQASCSGGGSGGVRTTQPQLSVAPDGSAIDPDPDPKAIARRMRARFRETPFLRVTGRIQASGRTIMVASMMGPDRIRSLVFEGKVCVAALSVVGTRTQEYAPEAKIGERGSVEHLLVEYDAPSEDSGRGQLSFPLILDSGESCLFGGFTTSWAVRPRAGAFTLPEFWAETLSASTFRGREKLGDRSCLKFERVVKTPGRTMTYVLYVDEQSMDLARWDGTQTRGTPESSLTRINEFLDIDHATTDRGWNWRLDARELRESEPSAIFAPSPKP